MAIDEGYRPPNTAQAIGGALGGMGEALMRISSMQSDRVDRAYNLARQNRLDAQDVRRIELDSQRLQTEALRQENLRAQIDADATTRGQVRSDALRTERSGAAETWRTMQDGGAGIITDPTTGEPVTTSSDIIERVRMGQPIRHLTTTDVTKGRAYQVAQAEQTLESQNVRDALSEGINFRTGQPLTVQERALHGDQLYSEDLNQVFEDTEQGRENMQGAELEAIALQQAAENRGDLNPMMGATDEERLMAGEILVQVEGETDPRWVSAAIATMAGPEVGGLSGLNYEVIQGVDPRRR